MNIVVFVFFCFSSVEKEHLEMFEYIKKHNRENGPALVGLEIENPQDIETLKERLHELGFQYEYLNKNDNLFQFLM